MHYTIKFSDGIIYNSPDIRSNDPGWASEQDFKSSGISHIEIKLPNGKTLTLEGFEKYNFFVEASQSFGKKAARIEAFFFCGAFQGHVIIWKIDFRTKQIVKNIAKEGLEYNGTPTSGWRMGLMGEKARSGIWD